MSSTKLLRGYERFIKGVNMLWLTKAYTHENDACRTESIDGERAIDSESPV